MKSGGGSSLSGTLKQKHQNAVETRRRHLVATQYTCTSTDTNSHTGSRTATSRPGHVGPHGSLRYSTYNPRGSHTRRGGRGGTVVTSYIYTTTYMSDVTSSSSSSTVGLELLTTRAQYYCTDCFKSLPDVYKQPLR